MATVENAGVKVTVEFPAGGAVPPHQHPAAEIPDLAQVIADAIAAALATHHSEIEHVTGLRAELDARPGRLEVTQGLIERDQVLDQLGDRMTELAPLEYVNTAFARAQHEHAASAVTGLQDFVREEVRAMLAAGRNVRLVEGDDGSLVVECLGGRASFSEAAVSRDLTDDDNARLVETFGGETDEIVLRAVRGLGRGFSCSVLQLGEAPARVRPGDGVVFLGGDLEGVTAGIGTRIGVICIEDSEERCVFLVFEE